jgi:hypothetical protein
MGWMVNATLRPLYPRERPGTHCIGDWLAPSARLDGCGKSRPQPAFGPRTVQPVASRYTDCAILAHYTTRYLHESNTKVIRCSLKLWQRGHW